MKKHHDSLIADNVDVGIGVITKKFAELNRARYLIAVIFYLENYGL